MLTGRTSYSRPVSSTMMWILCPLGVGQVYTSIIGNFLSFSSCSPFAVAPHSETQRKQLARPAGLEPTTPSLEGWCSIRFELRARARFTLQPSRPGCREIWSGWRDLNSRHLAPKASALPGCATPRGCRILRLRPWHGQRRGTGKFPVKSDLPALLISGIKLPSFDRLARRLRFGAAPEILPALPAEKG